MGQCFGKYVLFRLELRQRRAAAPELWSCIYRDKGKDNTAGDPMSQNPSVHGQQAGNPLGRMSMGKPTEDQLDRASVIRVQQ